MSEVHEPSSELTKASEENRSELLEEFIDEGIDLVRQGKFTEAVEYLRNENAAKVLGLNFDSQARHFLATKPMGKDYVKSMADSVAENSKFIPKEDKKGSIRIATVRTGAPILGKLLFNISKNLWHEVALIHLEEWLHALQHIKEVPLAGDNDKEVDVANYLQKRGIQLTNNFLVRRGKKSQG